MKIKVLRILESVIDTGIENGMKEAFANTTNPDLEQFKNSIKNHIISGLYEYFCFNDEF